MASILDVIKGLNQAASNAYDGYDHMDEKIGLRREEGNPIVDSRIIDGFGARFAAKNMIITYQSEIPLKEVHPRNQFENDIPMQKIINNSDSLKERFNEVLEEIVA